MKSLFKLGIILIGLAIFARTKVWGATPASTSNINWELLIYTVLGFVLGLFGNLILERIKRGWLRKDFVKSLYAQFKRLFQGWQRTILILR